MAFDFFKNHPTPWHHYEVMGGCESIVRDSNGHLVTKNEMIAFISMIMTEMGFENESSFEVKPSQFLKTLF